MIWQPQMCCNLGGDETTLPKPGQSDTAGKSEASAKLESDEWCFQTSTCVQQLGLRYLEK